MFVLLRKLGENESLYGAMFFTSIDSGLSDMQDIPLSVSWFVMMQTNIGWAYNKKRIRFGKSDIFIYENKTFDIFGEGVNH